MCDPTIAVAAITAVSGLATSAITAKAQKKQAKTPLQTPEEPNVSITDQIAKTANTVDNPTTINKKQNITTLNTKPVSNTNPINSGAYIENSLGYDKLGLNIGG